MRIEWDGEKLVGRIGPMAPLAVINALVRDLAPSIPDQPLRMFLGGAAYVEWSRHRHLGGLVFQDIDSRLHQWGERQKNNFNRQHNHIVGER